MNTKEAEIIIKWKPVIESLGITNPETFYSLAKYAESHSIFEMMEQYTVGYATIGAPPAMSESGRKEPPSLLPISLKILNKLFNANKFDRVKFINQSEEIKKSRLHVCYQMDNNIINEIRADLISHGVELIESLLIEEAIKKISDMIDEAVRQAGPLDSIIFFSDSLVQSISVIAESTLSPKICAILSFGIKTYTI